MWSALNRLTAAVFDAAVWPFARLGEPWALAWLGLLSAVLALLVFRFTSDQEALGRERDRMRAHLLELWIFRDDLLVSARAQARLLARNLNYLRHALLPLALMLLPFGLLVAQIEARYAWRALAPGEPALIRAELTRELDPLGVRAELRPGAGLARETPALRTRREVIWRVRPRTQGRLTLELELQGERLVFSVVAGGSDSGPLAPVLYRASDPRALLYPGADPLPAQPLVSALRIDYPRRGAAVAGLSSASWIWLGFSLLFALVLRRPLRVTL